MNKRFDFNDINLIPRYSVVDSRSECDTSITLGKHTFKNPIIPANMESVINEELAMKLAEQKFFYVMHRFDFDNVEFVGTMNGRGLVSSISVGVNEPDYHLIDSLSKYTDLNPDYITIDIAHGHCKKMKKMLKYIKEKLPETFVIAGNVSTTDATVDLDKWGADAIKVGIGPGCFIGDTKILTKNGYKNISDIKIGEYVLTHKNKYQEVISTISYIEEDDLININDNISTKNHKYYVINVEHKNIININNYEKYAKWIPANELDVDKHFLLELE